MAEVAADQEDQAGQQAPPKKVVGETFFLTFFDEIIFFRYIRIETDLARP